MTTSGRNPLRSWMFIYFGLMAAFIMAGQPDESEQLDNAVPMPAIVGEAPLFRKDI